MFYFRCVTLRYIPFKRQCFWCCINRFLFLFYGLSPISSFVFGDLVANQERNYYDSGSSFYIPANIAINIYNYIFTLNLF